VTVYLVPAVSDPLSRGNCNSDQREIRVVFGYDADSRCRTLVHEIGHALDEGSYIAHPNMTEREMVVDSVTLLAGRELGLDIETCSTIWSNPLYDDERARLTEQVNSLAWATAQAIGLDIAQRAA
jgi:hypothetical protein